MVGLTASSAAVSGRCFSLCKSFPSWKGLCIYENDFHTGLCEKYWFDLVCCKCCQLQFLKPSLHKTELQVTLCTLCLLK